MENISIGIKFVLGLIEGFLVINYFHLILSVEKNISILPKDTVEFVGTIVSRILRFLGFDKDTLFL